MYVNSCREATGGAWIVATQQKSQRQLARLCVHQTVMKLSVSVSVLLSAEAQTGASTENGDRGAVHTEVCTKRGV